MCVLKGLKGLDALIKKQKQRNSIIQGHDVKDKKCNTYVKQLRDWLYS